MATLHKKVIQVLRREFGKVTDALEQVPSTGRVTGVIISPAFNKLDDGARQRRLARALKAGLTKEEESNVGPIAVLTPAEADAKAAL
jgi:hypothetical protein